MIYELPIAAEDIKEIKETDTIDMHSLKFPDAVDPIITALLFLRNTGIRAKLLFDECTYEEKEGYLIHFMITKRMSATIPELASTWAYILVNMEEHSVYGDNIYSILSFDETKKFRERNKSLIDELNRFLISIPLCSIDIYAVTRSETKRIDMNEFEVSSYYGFNHFALIQLLEYPAVILLSQSITGIEPVFYQNYFKSNQCDVYPGFVGDLVNKFPHLQLMNIIMNNNQDLTDSFVDAIVNACTQ